MPNTSPTGPNMVINFKQYEHNGIDLVLGRTVGGGMVLSIVRTDTMKTLVKVELPQNTKLLDRRG